MSQFSEIGKLGYWWLHANNGLRYSSNCHGMKPEEFFDNWLCIKWWYVECELDWYRMMKEYKQLAEGPLEPIKA